MAAERMQVFKCNHCGLMVEVMDNGMNPVCCGENMVLQKENTVDAAKEKHVPVLEDNGTTINVKVGSVAHPMADDHYIEWIEVINGDYVNRKYLKPGDKPEAPFYLHNQPGIVIRAYCNKHGLWKA